MNTQIPVVLAIAGSDPLGGAGLQADIKTAAALGGYCCTVTTALTAQNSRGVSAVWPVAPEQLRAQFSAVTEDITPGAIKVGMLGNAALITELANLLRAQPKVPVVLDPVLAATAGGDLLSNGSGELVTQLLPRVTLLTPNLHEASRLLNCPPARDESDMLVQAKALREMGPRAVLIKGGHLASSRAIDILVSETNTVQRFESPRLAARNTHGTGCTLATAIATGLAAGHALPVAVACAKRFIQQAIAHADSLNLVAKNGPLQHFFTVSDPPRFP